MILRTAGSELPTLTFPRCTKNPSVFQSITDSREQYEPPRGLMYRATLTVVIYSRIIDDYGEALDRIIAVCLLLHLFSIARSP